MEKIKNLIRYFENNKINIIRYDLNKNNWDTLINKRINNSYYFLSTFIEYEKEKYKLRSEDTFSFIGYNELTFFVFKIYIIEQTYFFTFLRFKDSLNNNLNKKLCKIYINEINKLKSQCLIIPYLNTYDFYQSILYKKEFKSSVELYCDLTLDNDEIWKSIRSSYKPLINKYKENVRLITNPDRVLWDKCKSLHIKSAGYQTRSDRSWDIQFELLQEENALLYCFFENKELIGFSFFELGSEIITYGSAAYDRDYFNSKSISHSILWQSIIDSKIKYKKKLFYLGAYYLDEDIKQKNIIEFKLGFANIFLPGLR